MAMASVVVNW